MNKRTSVLILAAYFCVVATAECAPFSLRNYNYADFEASLRIRNFEQAAKRLEICADNSRNKDQARCVERIKSLPPGLTIKAGLIEEANRQDQRDDQQRKHDAFLAHIAAMRESKNPWDKYLLFSELTAGTVEPTDSQEVTRVGAEAFAGFADCAKSAEPSCMGMYGELILRGLGSLPEKDKAEGRRKALYWLTLAARYGYDPARKALIAEGENIPSPDLAMEQLQRQANSIARDTQSAQDRAAREQAIRDYEMIRESRRQAEQRIWANLFPKVVSCTTSTLGSNTYTNCW